MIVIDNIHFLKVLLNRLIASVGSDPSPAAPSNSTKIFNFLLDRDTDEMKSSRAFGTRRLQIVVDLLCTTDDCGAF